MDNTFIKYVGLIREDGTEPPASTGYKRQYVDILDNDCGAVFFDTVKEPGYGVIVRTGLFIDEESGDPVIDWRLTKPVEVVAGVTPFIQDGKLLCGVGVSAKSCSNTLSRNGTGGTV